MDWQERSRRLVGYEGVKRLGQAHVALFGLGGVGSFAAEALARSGVGRLSLVEYDRVTDSNRNRQIPALTTTVGRPKIEVCAARLSEIHPDLQLRLYPLRITGENVDALLEGMDRQPDFIADAIDDLPAKVALILSARARGIPLISCMGAGYRLDPLQLAVGDISETHTCPLARKLRHLLRDEGLTSGLPVVWSKEPPIPVSGNALAGDGGDPAKVVSFPGPASMVFVPAAAGLLMASHIVHQIVS